VNEAAGFFERALQVNPRDTHARYNLANALVIQQRWEPAANEFRKVLADNPDNSGARQRLGEVLRLLGYQSAKRAVSMRRLRSGASRYTSDRTTRCCTAI